MRAPTEPSAYQDGPIAYTIDDGAYVRWLTFVRRFGRCGSGESGVGAVTAIPSTSEMH